MNTETKRDLFFSLALILVIAGLYSISLPYPFIWDDEISITTNPGFATERYMKEIFTGHFFDAGLNHKFSTDSGFYRPLVGVSFIIDNYVWSGQAFGFRMTNIILHFLCSLLFYFLLKKLNLHQPVAFICALIFAVHPVHIGTVAYISGRTDLLRTFFMLLSLWAYGDKKTFSSLIFFLCSLLSKEDAVVLPVVLLASDLILNRRFQKKVLIFFLTTFGYLLMRRYVLHFSDMHDLEINLLYFGTIARSVFVYLRILICPYDLHFERFYPLVQNSYSAFIFIVLAVFALLLALKICSRHRKALFALVCLAAVFFPISNMIPIYGRYRKVYIFLADHFLYFPLMFLLIMAGLVLNRVWTGKKRSVIALLSGLTVLYLMIFFSPYIRVWHDIEFFYRHVETRTAFPFRVYNNLASYYGKSGDPQCLEYLKKLRRIMPEDYLYYYIVKTHWHYFQEKDLDKTIAVFEEAVAHGVRNPPLYYAMGDVYFEKKEIRKAIHAYEQALKEDDPNYLVFFRLGFFYEQLDGLEALYQAEKYFEKSLALNPDNKDIVIRIYNLRKKIYGEDHSKVRSLEEFLPASAQPPSP